MIASNYRQFPEALALQLALDFGSLLRWATARPGSRLLRAIRADRARLLKEHATVAPWFGPICEPDDRPTPKWVAEARRRAHKLSKSVQTACSPLFTETKGLVARIGRKGPPRWTLIGFNYAK